MKVSELKAVVPKDTVIWIESVNEEYCEAGEASQLSYKYDDKDISVMYPEHYASLYCTGITVRIEYPITQG